jgi:hypothetical protein
LKYGTVSDITISPQGAVVKKVIMYGDADSLLTGVQFFNKAGTLILSFGDLDKAVKKEFWLEDTERLIGIKSKLVGNNTSEHLDFVFVIGKYE